MVFTNDIVQRGVLYLLFSSMVVINALINTNIVPNTCFTSDDDVIDIGLSFQQCLQQCNDMVECLAVSYKPTMLACRTHLVSPVTTYCQGYIHSEKAKWTEESLPQYHSLGVVSSGGICPSVPDTDYGKHIGNRKNNKKKMTTMCRRGYIVNGTQTRECLAGSWSGTDSHCVRDPSCNLYLVTGVHGVADSQLSETSAWCETFSYVDGQCAENNRHSSADFARLDGTGIYQGGLVPFNMSGFYIQVDFLAQRLVAAIVMQGREGGGIGIVEYVTEYTVQVSNDCTLFTDITDKQGNTQAFPGTTGADVKVISPLPVIVIARCVRVSPTAWVNRPSLRWDIIGCYTF